MMYATQYPNNSRTVIGTPILFNDDVVLYCDTTLGPVTINLLQIASGSWNTTWKLYVIDKSNNAGVNNITINAGIGQKINNASTLVLNVNSASALVRIASNTSFVASLDYTSGLAGNLEVLNQGVSITLGATSMNFLGIQATAIGSAVTIQNNFIVLSYVSLLTLISTNSLIPSQQYMITDAIFTTTVLETVPIVVTAITVNEISLCGSGIFLNADYQKIGNYSGVPGFVSQLGIWKITLMPVIGDVCIWNNHHWVNNTGVNGGFNPSIDLVNWTVLSKSSVTGYITEIDNINYKVETNEIISREDVRNNKVENFNGTFGKGIYEAFYVFQWGSNNTFNNIVISKSVMECCNWTGIQYNNTLRNGSAFIIRNYGNKNLLTGNNLDFAIVTFENDNIINNNSFANYICQVYIYNLSNFTNNIIDSPGVYTCNGTSYFNNNTFKNTGVDNISITQDNGTFVENNIYFCPTFNIDRNTSQIIGNHYISSNLIFTANDGIHSNNKVNKSNIKIAVLNVGFNFNNNEFIDTILDFNSISADYLNNYCNACNLTIVEFLTADFSYTWSESAILNVSNIATKILGGIYQQNVGTIPYSLDMDAPGVYDLLTQTLNLPIGMENLIGEWRLFNQTGKTVSKITNLNKNSNYATRFVPKDIAGTITFKSIAIAGAVIDKIISNNAPFNYVLTGRSSGEDSIYIRRLGDFNGVEQVYIYT